MFDADDDDLYPDPDQGYRRQLRRTRSWTARQELDDFIVRDRSEDDAIAQAIKYGNIEGASQLA